MFKITRLTKNLEITARIVKAYAKSLGGGCDIDLTDKDNPIFLGGDHVLEDACYKEALKHISQQNMEEEDEHL